MEHLLYVKYLHTPAWSRGGGPVLWEVKRKKGLDLVWVRKNTQKKREGRKLI